MKTLLTLFLLFISFFSTLSAQAKAQDNNYHFYLIDSYNTQANSNTYTPSTKPMVFEDEEPQKLDVRYENIVKELAYMQVFAVATIGVIAILPESVSQWSPDDKSFDNIQELLGKHADNIAKGPVLDDDAWAVNYIGHPVAGSYFYVWGRQAGLTWQESTILTTLMSTFYWEYGWEAFAEVPSTQDLIVTPVLGSLLGEGTNYLYNKLMENDGKIYDSVFMGSIGRVLLNPIGEINKIFANAFDTANIEISVDYSYAKNPDNYALRNMLENHGQIQSYFKLNFKLKY